MENSKSLLDKKIDLKWYFRVVVFQQVIALGILISMVLTTVRYSLEFNSSLFGLGSTIGLAGVFILLFSSLRLYVAYKICYQKNQTAYLVGLFLSLLSIFSLYFLGALFELYVLLLKENRKEFLTKEFIENLKEKFV